MQSYWHRQDFKKPLYSDLLWSRPENRRQAGKLLIVGGNAQGFAAAAEAYAGASKAGIGTARVLLPDSLQKTVGLSFQAGEYGPSTPSGSFSRQALSTLLGDSAWSDLTLLAGDLSHNSETAILLEQFILKHQGLICLTKDAADYFTKSPLSLINRQQTLLVISLAQLQKIAMSARFQTAFTFDMDLNILVDRLHDFSSTYGCAIIVKHLDNMCVAFGGQVSTTKLDQELAIWRVATAAKASVWWLQNPKRTFEALTTSVAQTETI